MRRPLQAHPWTSGDAVEIGVNAADAVQLIDDDYGRVDRVAGGEGRVGGRNLPGLVNHFATDNPIQESHGRGPGGMLRAVGVHQNVRVRQNHGIDRACGVDSISISAVVSTGRAKAERAATAASRSSRLARPYCRRQASRTSSPMLDFCLRASAANWSYRARGNRIVVFLVSPISVSVLGSRPGRFV